MAQRLHLLPHRTPTSSDPAAARAGPGARVYAVQRAGALLVALFLLVFGLLGFASGAAFLSTEGRTVLGMSSNGLLSSLSVLVAAVLLGSALHSPRAASTVMLVLGPLFLLSAFVNAFVIGTRLNWLAFELGNVVFSVVVGLPMLLLGAYGRIGGHLPPDSPYAHPHDDDEIVDERPATPEEVAAEAAMRDAEVAVVQHAATAEQRERVAAMAPMHHRADRRRVWMELAAADRQAAVQGGPPPDRGSSRGGRRAPWRRTGPRPG